LSVRAAASEHSTLVALVIVVVGGSALLLPALAFLFWLVLSGALDMPPAVTARVGAYGLGSFGGLRLWLAGGCLVSGTACTVLIDPGWGRVCGVGLLACGGALAFPPLADESGGPVQAPRSHGRGK
jgi:hypothetical protein